MMQQVTLEEFLAPISARLGHDELPSDIKPFNYKQDMPARQTDGMTQPELVERFAEEAAKIRVDVRRISPDEVAAAICDIIAAADEEGSVVFANDARFDELGIPAALEESDAVAKAVRWDPEAGRDAMERACNTARFGITYAQGAIAETGTIVQPCSVDCGRSISLLPLAHIALVDSATVKATMGDWLAVLREEGGPEGDGLPSQVCFISGPSVTSDIELVRVEGVHGPMFVHYVIIER